jgi:hypothetical protein
VAKISVKACIEFIKGDFFLSGFDYLVILDMDDINAGGFDPHKVIESIKYLEEGDTRAAIFANQMGTYYDMWALRHNTLCPNDIWEEVLDYAEKFKVSDELAYLNTFKKKILSIDPQASYLEVDSAFGGLGIYKMAYILANKNPYLGSKVKVVKNEKNVPVIFKFQTCEHVHFNQGIRAQGGTLFIKPDLINGKGIEFDFLPSAFRSMIF